MRVKECDKEFLDEFWDCLAILLDYFADFLIHDTATMQSVWFHLLDVVQEAGELPHTFWEPNIPACDHARQFSQHYSEVLVFTNQVIVPLITQSSDTLIRPNVAQTTSPTVDLGNFRAGLKPWHQFLYNQGPGFDVVLNNATTTPCIWLTSDDKTTEQYIPMGALAIIQKYNEKLRALTKELGQVSVILAIL